MTGVPHASSDPNAGVPAADQSIIRQVEQEQHQAFVTELFDPLGFASGNGGGSAGFSFSPEQIEAQRKQCEQLKFDLESDQGHIETIVRVTPPAPDQAGSVMHANALRKLGEDLQKRNQSQIRFLKAWLDKLNTAQQQYMETERLTQAQWTRLASGLDA